MAGRRTPENASPEFRVLIVAAGEAACQHRAAGAHGVCCESAHMRDREPHAVTLRSCRRTPQSCLDTDVGGMLVDAEDM